MNTLHFTKKSLGAALVAFALLGAAGVASAQTTNTSSSTTTMASTTNTNTGTMNTTSSNTTTNMPTFYDQAGNQVGANGASMPAGYYYLQTGGGHQIYYYGNGTYYDPTTQTYGGMINGANGTTGSTGGTGSTGSTGTVGFPNTGEGGNAAANWALIVTSGALAIGGAAYLTATRRKNSSSFK